MKLSKQKSEEYFFNALCNGMHLMQDYGLELEYSNDAYRKVRKDGDSHEDVLMAMLKAGYGLTLIDGEGDDEEFIIGIKDVWDKVQKTDSRHLGDMISENDDAITADVIIQTVFLGEVIYG